MRAKKILIECPDCGQHYEDTVKAFREHSVWHYHKVQQAKRELINKMWMIDSEEYPFDVKTRLLMADYIDERLEELARDLINGR